MHHDKLIILWHLWQSISFPVHLDNSWYSCGQPVGWCTVSVPWPGREIWRIRCYNYPITDGQHESHGRPFWDAELLEQLRTGMIERVFNPIARLENVQQFTVSQDTLQESQDFTRSWEISQDLTIAWGSSRVPKDLMGTHRMPRFIIRSEMIHVL